MGSWPDLAFGLWIADPGLCSGETEKVNLWCEFDFSVSHHVWSSARCTVFIDFSMKSADRLLCLLAFCQKDEKT